MATGRQARRPGEQRAALGYDERYRQRLIKRRLEALAVARTMDTNDVQTSAIEAFEPEELQHIN